MEIFLTKPTMAAAARWLYPLALATLVVIASGRSHVAAPQIVNIDKLVHFSIFGLLATLVVRCPGMRHAWATVLVVSLFGVSDELRQSFTPGRLVEFADWLADTAGAIVAVTAYTMWAGYRRLLEMPLRLPRFGRRRASTLPPKGETDSSVTSTSA